MNQHRRMVFNYSFFFSSLFFPANLRKAPAVTGLRRRHLQEHSADPPFNLASSSLAQDEEAPTSKFPDNLHCVDGALSLPAGKFDYRKEPLEGCEPRANEAAVSFSSIGCLRGLSFAFSGFPASLIQSNPRTS